MKRRTFISTVVAAGIAFALAPVAAALAQVAPPGFARAIAVQEANTDRLLAIDGVVGTGIGVDTRGQAAVVVMTEDLGVRGLPRQLDGVSMVVMVTGRFQAVHHREGHDGGPPGGGGDDDDGSDDTTIDPTSRFDPPVPIGVSTGNINSCSAGTIGARVSDGGSVYALSNNHVYALENKASIGDLIVQPGVFDTDCDVVGENEIGTLAAFVPIDLEGDNTVDAAIAASTTDLLGNATPEDGYGLPGSVPVEEAVGQAVQKYGRTTSLTTGTVAAINATVNVSYSNGTATFVQQIVVDGDQGGFLRSGDSGSLLVLQSDNAPVGLLFASGRGGKIAIANPIDLVLAEFGVAIDGGP